MRLMDRVALDTSSPLGVCCSVLLAFLILVRGDPAAGAEPCHRPAILDDGWEVATPQAAGLDAGSLCAALDDTATRGNIHAIVVERHGRLVAELYRRGQDRQIWSFFTREVDFGPTTPHDLRSVTKSVVGLLFGIAHADGKIGPLSTPVLDLYPDDADLRSPARNAITLEHLLTMSSGLQWNEDFGAYGSRTNDDTRLYWTWSIRRYVLDRPIVAAPGSQWNYSGGNAAVLGEIVARAAGLSLPALAGARLFEPLGIHDWKWVGDLYGRPMAEGGLRMRPRDMAKIGRLVLDRGLWRGRQIVPADWIATSLRPHIRVDDDGLQYGYLWWTAMVDHHGRRLPWAGGFGNGGQRIFVVPDLDLVVVVTAGAYSSTEIGRVVRGLLGTVVNAVDDGRLSYSGGDKPKSRLTTRSGRPDEPAAAVAKSLDAADETGQESGEGHLR
jgi:CubicO group peptidase (beta-lactamase class C family)